MSKKCICTPKGLLDEILQSKLDEKDASPELLNIAKGETERKFHGEVPERPDGLTLNEHFDQLNRKMPKGRGLEKQAFRDGLLVSSKRNSNVETTARMEAEYGKKGTQGLTDNNLIKKANARTAELPTTEITVENAERTQVLMRELDRRIAKGYSDLVDVSKLQEARTAIGLAHSEYSKRTGQATQTITGRDDVQKALDTAMEEAFTPQNKKLQADIDKAISAIPEDKSLAELLGSKAINKGTRDIDTKLQDLKDSQGTQPQTADDIRRGAGVLMGHDSFLAKETLEALGYPLTFSKKRKDANSTGWSVLIGGKKVELYPSDSLGGLLRRNKLESAFENGLVKKKAGDVVKGLIDDLDPNDLTLNETELKQKLTAYGEGLPKDGGLLTSREDEAFTLLDNAKTPEELNAVEAYVSERIDKYEEGFYEEFYNQFEERQKALVSGYQGKVADRVAKADETRQLKETEQINVLKKQLDASNKKLEALQNELANIDPIAMIRKTETERIKQDPKGALLGYAQMFKNGEITKDQFKNHLRNFPVDIVNMMAKTVGCA